MIVIIFLYGLIISILLTTVMFGVEIKPRSLKTKIFIYFVVFVIISIIPAFFAYHLSIPDERFYDKRYTYGLLTFIFFICEFSISVLISKKIYLKLQNKFSSEYIVYLLSNFVLPIIITGVIIGPQLH